MPLTSGWLSFSYKVVFMAFMHIMSTCVIVGIGRFGHLKYLIMLFFPQRTEKQCDEM